MCIGNLSSLFISLQQVVAVDSVQNTGAEPSSGTLNSTVPYHTCAEPEDEALPVLEPAVSCTSRETETVNDKNDVTMGAEMVADIPSNPPQPERNDNLEIAADMPKLERKDAADSVAVSIPAESRSPSPPLLQHKDVVDRLTELEQSEDSLPLPNFCQPESEEEMDEVDVDGGKLASGNDVFLGMSLGGSSAGGSGRSSTMAVLHRQRAGECEMELAEGGSEKTSELCNSRDFADSDDDDDDDMLRNGFSGSELSIHSGSPTMMTDVDSDDNATMIGGLFDAAAADCSAPPVVQNGKPALSPAGETRHSPCDDVALLDKLAEDEHPASTELHTDASVSDTCNHLNCTEMIDDGASTLPSSKSESSQSPAANNTESVTCTAPDVFDGNILTSVSEETGVDDAVTTVKSQELLGQVGQNSPAASVLERLLSESSQIPSPVHRSTSVMPPTDSRFDAVTDRNEPNSPVTRSTADNSVDAEGHPLRQAPQLSADLQHLAKIRSPSDLGRALSVPQPGSVASPASSCGTTPLAQLMPSFVNVESPSIAGVVPRGSCSTPGMDSVNSPYAGGYRRLSSGSGSHVQQHVSPEMNVMDQRMQSPAGYCSDYPPVRQGSYAVKPLHDASYQAVGGPQSLLSAGVGSPGSSCTIMSPNGSYVRAQSFGSSTHSPATRFDQSPASAGSGSYGGSCSGSATQQGSFNQPNPSPSGSSMTGRGVGGGTGLANKSPVGSTNVFSPAPAAAMSPSIVVTSAMDTFSTPLQPSNIAVPFSCSPPDAGLPFHFLTNVAVPVTATSYANAPSPTPRSLQLLSPSSSNRVSTGYQTAAGCTNTVRRHPVMPPQQLSSAVGLPYYGLLQSSPTTMAYAGMIDHRFADAPLDQLMSTFSAGSPPSGRQTAPISRTVPSDCSLVQLQQLTNRLTNQSAQARLDGSYGTPASQPMGLLLAKSDQFTGDGSMPDVVVNQACKQTGRHRAATTDKTSPAGSIQPVPLPPHAASYNMLGMFRSQHQPVPHAASPLDYQRYFANAGFFGQSPSQLPMQMMPFGPPGSRSSTTYTPQALSQTQGGNQMYSSYGYGRVSSDLFKDVPRR